jgi:hypothetical protein
MIAPHKVSVLAVSEPKITAFMASKLRAISTISIERRCRTVAVEDGSGSW